MELRRHFYKIGSKHGIIVSHLGKFSLKDANCGINLENYDELQEKTKTLDEPPDMGKSAVNMEKLLAKPVQVEPNTGIKIENWEYGMALNKESNKENSDYSTAFHKQENASSEGENQHFSAVLSPLTLS